MASRLVPAFLILLLVVFQAQLWFGRGSVGEVADMQRRLQSQQQENLEATEANERLASEVRDLKEGLEMVEEKARMELGMVKPDEIYIQVSPHPGPAAASAPAPMAPVPASLPSPAARR